MRRHLLSAASIAVMTASLLAWPATAEAHERRMVGPYQFVVGWNAEPAYQGQPNAATVRITDTRANPAKAMEGLEQSLAIQVFSGGLTRAFSGKTRAVFGQPGLYALDVIPTVPGGYKYKVAGKIESLDVNETFESGPSTFGDIVAAGALEYPDSVPAGVDLTRQLADIRSTVDQTRILSVIAVVVGLAGLGAALLMRRRA